MHSHYGGRSYTVICTRMDNGDLISKHHPLPETSTIYMLASNMVCNSLHNCAGLARKEDFAYITYDCPHCNALNKPKNSEENLLIPPVSALLVTDSPSLIVTSEVVN